MRFSEPENLLGNEALAKIESLVKGKVVGLPANVRIRNVTSDNPIVEGLESQVVGRFAGQFVNLDWRSFVSHVGASLIDLEKETEWIRSLGNDSDSAYDLADYIFGIVSDSAYEESVAYFIGNDDIAEMAIENLVNDLCLAVRYRFVQRNAGGFLSDLLDAILAGYYPCGFEGDFPDGQLVVARVVDINSAAPRNSGEV